MLAQIREYFEDRGVTAKDFPKAFLAHQVIGAAFLALTWAACYQIEPTKSPMFAPVNKSIQESNNFFVKNIRQSYASVISKAERRMGQEWFSKRGIDSGRVAVSLAESTVIRKLAKPVTIPAKLWLTWKFVQAVNMGKTDDAEDGDQENSWWGFRRSTGETTSNRVGTRESDRGEVARRGAAKAVQPGSPTPGGRRLSRDKGRGWGLGLGGSEGGRRARRKAACSPFGSVGPGCFVLPVRRPVCVTAVSRTATKGVGGIRPATVQADLS